MLTILLWLWRSDPPVYTHEHVNIAARMIDRNLSLPHRFVVVTDTPEADFDSRVTPIPLWDDWRAVPANWGANKVNCYVRLKAFSDEAREIIGERFVSIDLDCVVLGNDDQAKVEPFLDPLFDRGEDFVMLRRFMQNGARPANVYQGSMWMLTAGSRTKVWENFKGEESAKQTKGLIGTDQAWITHQLGPDEAGWTHKDGVVCWPDLHSNHTRYRMETPPVKMIFFNCNPKPHELCRPIRVGESVKWPWIERYYR